MTAVSFYLNSLALYLVTSHSIQLG